jgi:molybdate transport system substrate-binding protein
MSASSAMSDVHVLSSMATREILNELTRLFSQRTGRHISTESAGGVDVLKRVQADAQTDRMDLVVLASTAIDQLIAQGKLLADTRLDFVNSGIGVAVRSGTSRPDLGSESTLRDALLAAPSLGYSTGPSGTYLLKMFQAMGIYEIVQQRIVQAPAGVPVAALIASGEVALGFQQISELINAPGIELVGPLPPALQMVTTFSAAATVRAQNSDVIHELLVFMNHPEADAVKRRFGMEPVTR